MITRLYITAACCRLPTAGCLLMVDLVQWPMTEAIMPGDTPIIQWRRHSAQTNADTSYQCYWASNWEGNCSELLRAQSCFSFFSCHVLSPHYYYPLYGGHGVCSPANRHIVSMPFCRHHWLFLDLYLRLTAPMHPCSVFQPWWLLSEFNLIYWGNLNWKKTLLWCGGAIRIVT